MTFSLHFVGTASAWIAAAGGCTPELGMMASNTLWWTAMQQNVAPEAMSRVISYEYASTLSIMPVGAALAGPLSHAIGVSPAMIACCAAAIAVNVSMLLVRDIRMLPTGPGPARMAPEAVPS
jgi:hypothetical protein